MTNPRLRLLDFQRIHHQGEPMWLLRDPWQLGERQLIFPDALAQLLLFCDVISGAVNFPTSSLLRMSRKASGISADVRVT